MNFNELMEIACFEITDNQTTNNEYQTIVRLRRKDNNLIIGNLGSTVNIPETSEMINESRSADSMNEIDWEDLTSRSKVMLANALLLQFQVEDYHFENMNDLMYWLCEND